MQRKRPKRPNNFFKNGFLWVLVFLALMGIVHALTNGNETAGTEELSQSEFVQKLENSEVEKFTLQPKAGAYEISGQYRQDEKQDSDQESETDSGIPIFNNTENEPAQQFVTNILPNDTTLATISKTARDSDTAMETLEEDQSGMWLSLIFSAIPIVFFVIIIYMMFNQSQGGGRNNPMSMGKSRAVDQSKQKVKVRFSDVAGADEEKQELVEIVDFLKDPSKYQELGARIPKGVLLEGPPGTGKTLLAKAVAGEAGVPFYSISGSEFVEMFVGVGASRVRDLFENAKKNAPAIVFIDEIDAVGRKRGPGTGGGHDEREQTLNQLLVEMDGFTDKDNVIVMAATNRSDVLDNALLRPGRFDRQILVGRPDVKGREAILKVHARNKRLADDVDLKMLAQQTPGFTGAELENVLNEAALVAARVDKKQIDMVDIDEAQDRVIAGPAKKDKVISKAERQMVAFHEAGHTIVGMVLSDARVVHKVTIVPRGKAGGYAIMLPKEDQYIYTKKDLREQVVGLLGGRAAEQVVFSTQTSGASNDFEQATGIVRSMITEYGMSDLLGPVSYEGNYSMRGASSPYSQGKAYSDRVAAQIDEQVRDFMDDCLQEAMDILVSHRDQLNLIAEKLLELETLDAKTIKSLFETGQMPDEAGSDQEVESDAKSYDEVKREMQRQLKDRQETEKEARVNQGEQESSKENDSNQYEDDELSEDQGRNAYVQQDRDDDNEEE
ncbi:ATP-dependent zinc metalloprotease FtsH [Aerococcus kribbianus]|uniref:ATP-dependent zinc metalloprotease FtsH n=1 Tax=Aerococcus kribbianus TaxID=2999064 RepID=A0A9X3JE19_9LACT|nr:MULTISPECIES: ATP-dependent zinc metalloprotease FtsH [unclassified Aerococcus]MCZ0718043.1 ATP-dependent zinc metalloprotease FtsH [Aerococcus sp. YH-aer221]MCZ0726388.1 ATP-dependent zinc metalloprotease FtsH [Aerococcus sp. YH-aer222]